MLQHLLFLRPSIEGVSLTTENLVFKLVYAISSPLFLACGVIFYSRVCFTDPINCVVNSTDSFKVLKAFDSYCLENAYILQEESDYEDGRQYQKSYQYVGLFYLVCAILCYLPYVLWEWFENGLLKSLLQELSHVTLTDQEKIQEQIRKLMHVWEHNRTILRTYASGTILCEVCNLICILSLFVLGQLFLRQGFFPLGIMGHDQMQLVFPKIALCSLEIEHIRYDGICTMNLNYLSEKLFLLTWWWCLFTLVLTCANILYRYMSLANVNIRVTFITDGHFNLIGKLLPYVEEDQDVSSENYRRSLNKLETYTRSLSYGEYFMLKRIQANVTPHRFLQILESFNSRFSNKERKEE